MSFCFVLFEKDSQVTQAALRFAAQWKITLFPPHKCWNYKRVCHTVQFVLHPPPPTPLPYPETVYVV